MDQQDMKIKRSRRKAVPAQYRRKWPVKKIIIGAAAVLCLCIVIFSILHFGPDTSSPVVPQHGEKQVIHLVAGGDVNITDASVAAGQSAGGYDYTEVFKDVLPVLSSGDVTVLNFEGVFSGSEYGTNTKAAPGELLTALKNAGVDVLQTANSYSIYDGLRGLKSTIQRVQNAGMTPLGTYATNSEFSKSGGYIIWEIKGVKIALMAFTKGMDGMGLPSGSENCVNLLYTDYNSTYQKVDKNGIAKVVRNAAAHKPDVMIALVHWGSEFNDQISKSQKTICNLLQEEGVDAIIGTHPHYVQKMELNEETGQFIAWSLGDFYGEGTEAGTNYSVLLDLEITKDSATGVTKITGFDYVPLFLDNDGEGNLRVLRIQEALIGYENRYLNCVSEATYNAMKSALSRIESRVNGK